MNLPRKKLPIGIQTLSELIRDRHYYVDKTGYARRLIESGKVYFLSRPRRFGKSLFLDTLKEIFEGNEPLFRGLAIHPHWDWSVRYPVLRISFGGAGFQTRADLDEVLDEQLCAFESTHGLPREFDDARSRLKRLIIGLHQKTGLPVVVLIDEYDKPILDRIEQSEIAREMREALKDFYSVLKDADAHLKFVFLTGVSKFSKVSLFSGLNHLNDITLAPEYSALCGYTDADVDSVFAPELFALDREQIRHWYNGYNWLGEPVYNPFDLLLLFDKRKFQPYWFETGTPTFLIKLLSSRDTWLPELAHLQSSADLLSTFDVDDIPTEALMFQAGYLTIESEQWEFTQFNYRLRYPNHEVYQSLNNVLLRAWSPDASLAHKNKRRLGQLLLATDFDGMKELFTGFFASIPHQWFTNTPIARYEGYYASVFYAYFASLGLDIVCEESSHAGRLDMAVRCEGQVFLFEFKLVDGAAEGQALAQIKARGYAERYRGEACPVHAIGVEFDRQSRQVVGFAAETLLGR